MLLCPRHGVIDRLKEGTLCPVAGCGRQMTHFDNELDAAIALGNPPDYRTAAANLSLAADHLKRAVDALGSGPASAGIACAIERLARHLDNALGLVSKAAGEAR